MFGNHRLTGTLVLLGALTLVSVTAEAGGESSGGGNGVVCFDHPAIAAEVNANGGIVSDSDLEHITFLEMVDLYQARKPRGLPPRPPEIIPISEELSVSDSQAMLDYFGKLEKRFTYVVPELADGLKMIRQMFTNDYIVSENNPVRPMRDADLEIEIDTHNCALTTMAFSEIISDQVIYVHLDSRLFDLHNAHITHSRLSKVVLMLHEYFYLLSRFINHETTSKKTRDLIGYLITQKTGISIDRFVQILFGLGFGPNLQDHDIFNPTTGGVTTQNIYASYPWDTMIIFIEQAYHNEMINAYIATDNNIYGGDAGFWQETSNFFWANGLGEMDTSNLSQNVAYLEVLLGKRGISPTLTHRLTTADAVSTAQKLLVKALDLLEKRRQAVLAAGEKLINEKYAPQMEAIPYLDADTKSKLIAALHDTAAALARESAVIEVVSIDGTRRGASAFDYIQGDYGKRAFKAAFDPSRLLFLDPILRRTELPLAPL
jgi:hypothetical protein